jgi:hypothetical protein
LIECSDTLVSITGVIPAISASGALGGFGLLTTYHFTFGWAELGLGFGAGFA